MKNVIIKTISMLIIMWILIIIIDTTLVINSQNPFFILSVQFYKDGGSYNAFGLGYKVDKYVDHKSENWPEDYKIIIAPFFVDIENPYN